MENPGDTQTNTVIEISPDGDLILIVGPEEAKLRVHSMFLTLVSKPFSAMLGPDWKEGHDLLDSNKPAEILLPEDNAAALEIICSIIHHQNRDVPRTLAAGDILAVAVTADKYDCIRALRFASESWLRSSRDEASSLMLLTAAAYLFQDAQAFKEITRALILDHHGPYLALSCEEIESAMTWRSSVSTPMTRLDILLTGERKGLLEEQRGFARLKVAEILISGVNDGTGLCVHKCGWTSKYAYAYIKRLEREDLWPAQLHHISISKALESAERMPDPIPEEPSIECTYEYKHAAPAYRRNRTWSLEDLNKSIGLCIHCVRSGSMNSNCRQESHRY